MITSPLPARSGSAFSRESLAGDLCAGTLTAVVGITYALSYASLVFSGNSNAYLSIGVTAALTSFWVINLVLAARSHFSFASGGPDANTTAILAIAAPALIAGLQESGVQPPVIAATVLGLVMCSSLLVGAVPLLLGLLRQGRWTRFIPYPVSGGFLAGMGFLFTATAFKMLTGEALTVSGLPALLRVPPLALVTTALVAALLFVAPHRIKHPLATPVILVVGTLVFYSGMWLLRIDVAGARAAGLLAQPLPGGGLALSPLAELNAVRWDMLALQWPSFLALALVPLISIPLHTAAIEAASKHESDFDRELRVSGAASLVTGILGGMPGFIGSARSLFHRQAGATSRVAGLVVVALGLAATMFLTPALAYVPRPVLAGLLLPFGINILREWLWSSVRKVPFLDYVVIVAVMLVFAISGLAAGILVGVVVCALLFVYHASHSRIIRHDLSGAFHRSMRGRSPQQLTILESQGTAMRALLLQGQLFFGTSGSLIEACRPVVQDPAVRYLLLDFRLVFGLDISAATALARLQQSCIKHGTTLVLTGLSAWMTSILRRNGLITPSGPATFPDLDRGLEWVEGQLLIQHAGGGLPAPAHPLTVDVNEILMDHFKRESLKELREYWEVQRFAPGETIFRRGDVGEELFFVEEGEVSVMLPAHDGPAKRLLTHGPGTIVGEMAIYTSMRRSADVVAETACRIWVLPAENLALMERVNPDLAIQFHVFIVKTLAARLTAANQDLGALS